MIDKTAILNGVQLNSATNSNGQINFTPTLGLQASEDFDLTQKSVFELIPYEEVENVETQFYNGLTLSSRVESPEERPVQELPSNEGHIHDGKLVLRRREYRTARHMAFIETQISRRTSRVDSSENVVAPQDDRRVPLF